MSKELLQFIDQIGREKGLDREVVIRAVEEALSSAIKKRMGTTLELYTTIDRLNGAMTIAVEKRIAAAIENRVEEITLEEGRAHKPDAEIGEVVRIPLDLEYLARIAAQVAKQVIIQKVREAERDMIHNGYKDRQGEIITGRVSNRDRGDLMVELGRAEALLPKNQQIPHETYRVGDHLRAYILDVQRATRGPQIILSRTDPNFLRRLFELEVPEIHDGIVEIKGVVREPGERAKVAVVSHQRDVDPVGSCVGIKGSRVQAIVRELRGEKIDIIEWSEDIATYVKNALSPAAIQEIRINRSLKHILVIVPDEELSQAIGKRGQNVRLASRLVEWEIDIKSTVRLAEEQHEQEEIRLRQELAEKLEIPIAAAAALVTAGYRTVDDLRGLEADDVRAMLPAEREDSRTLAKTIVERLKNEAK